MYVKRMTKTLMHTLNQYWLRLQKPVMYFPSNLGTSTNRSSDVAFHPVEFRHTSIVSPQPLSTSKKSPRMHQTISPVNASTARDTPTASPKKTWLTTGCAKA